MNEEKVQTNKERNIDEEILDLIIARLEAMPSNASLSIGGGNALDASELIKHVKANDEIGKTIVEIQLNYLRSLKDLPVEADVSSDH